MLDADLPNGLKMELRQRGYDVERLRDLNLHQLQDVPMLRALREVRTPAEIVLVTSDDRMPRSHGPTLQEVGFAVATIYGRWQDDPRYDSQDCWRRDAIHRWAHRMVVHSDKEIRRYTPGRSSVWKARIR